MSKFTPVDETEYAARNLWPKGWYSAEITGCEEKLSAKGNLMFKTLFKVFNEDGAYRLITSYVMADGAAKFQLRACAEAFGVLDAYKAGTLTEDDLKGRSGFVKLDIESDKNGVFDDKNIIRDFRKSAPGTVRAIDLVNKPSPRTKKETEESIGDDIPF